MICPHCHGTGIEQDERRQSERKTTSGIPGEPCTVCFGLRIINCCEGDRDNLGCRDEE